MKVGGVTINMTGGKLSVRGAPIHTIRWGISPGDKDEAWVSLEGTRRFTIEESYLEDAWNLIGAAFSAFIQKELPVARKG
jgi:hypothetical protein